MLKRENKKKIIVKVYTRVKDIKLDIKNIMCVWQETESENVKP